MASLGARSGRLYIDFRYQGKRYRESTSVADTPANRKQFAVLLKKMEAEITLDTFDYQKYFPEGKSSELFKSRKADIKRGKCGPRLFNAFCEVWFSEKQVEWRQSYKDTVRNSLDVHILPYFDGKALDEIDKGLIMSFRAHLTTLPGQSQGTSLSASRVNHIMTPLRMIITEGSDRFKFQNPWQNIKSLKEPRTNVEPFTFQDVQLILDKVRKDYQVYYTTRFFTGMRSSEVDGLLWKYVDFDRKQILVREALVRNRMVGTKTDGSTRDIDMNSIVYESLLKHKELVGERSSYVFSGIRGKPLHNRNVTQRVWYPLLRYLNLSPRRPYQTRHTAATLWLAAGEAPEWIARQMGHTTTEMLFRIYSRYVPNLTRQDGSAFERLLQSQFKENGEKPQ